METKPFTIQSPEAIAKEYGGNKQKIAEAMQMGIVDPTAGTLAGMFIDRMRSAQMQEQAPQQTVAQQVFAPPAPPQGAMPPAGLGALPPGAGAMPPEAAMGGLGAAMPAPPEVPAPPMGMAAGGFAYPADKATTSYMPSEPGMYDEQNGDSVGSYADGGLASLYVPEGALDYAGGGLVAFAGGGPTYDDFYKAIVQQESGGRYGIPNAQGSGAMGLGQIMPGTAKALAARLGLDYRPDLLAGKSKEARAYQDALTQAATKEAWEYGKGDPALAATYYHAGPNKKGWGPKTRRYSEEVSKRLGMETGKELVADAGNYGNTVYGFGLNPESNIELMSRLAPPEAEEQKQAREALAGELSPEELKKDRQAAFWEGVGKFAERLGASKSQSFLGGLAESVGGGAGDIAESLRAEEKDIRERKKEYLDLVNAPRKEKVELMKMGVDLTGAAAKIKEGIADREAKVEADKANLALQYAQIQAQIDAAKIAASAKERDFYTEAVMAEYARLKAENAAKPYQGNMPANREPGSEDSPYQLKDEFLLAQAYNNIIGMRGKSASSYVGSALDPNAVVDKNNPAYKYAQQ